MKFREGATEILYESSDKLFHHPLLTNELVDYFN